MLNKDIITEKVENIVAKREIAHDEQFLLLPQCFQKSSAADVSESVYMWERFEVSLCLNYRQAKRIWLSIKL